jgi:hypothetical protein
MILNSTIESNSTVINSQRTGGCTVGTAGRRDIKHPARASEVSIVSRHILTLQSLSYGSRTIKLKKTARSIDLGRTEDRGAVGN